MGFMIILNDEARVDDAGFFAQLVPGLPELQSVYDAVAVADWALAQSAFVRYMLERTHPCWMFDWRDRNSKLMHFVDRSHMWGTNQLASMQERVDGLMTDVFVDGAGEHHDISDLPGFLKGGLKFGEQAQYITMFNWAMDLGEMYARTRDAVYARKFSDLFVAYDQAFPRVVTNHDPDHPWLDETVPPTWHEMFVGKAAVHLLNIFYTGILHDPCITDDVVYRVIRKLWFHAAQFTRFTDVRTFKHYNHHWYERGTCPFVLGLMLPEFIGFHEMSVRGREVINDHLEKDFFTDGTYREHSTSYQSSTLAVDLLFPWAVAHANDVNLIASHNLPVIRSWLRWYASMTQPNGELPAIGDAFAPKSLARLARGATLAKDSGIKGFVMSLANCATENPDGSSRDNAVGLEDALRSAWDHLVSSLPDFTSCVFEDGGWVALRDSWERDAMYSTMSVINSPEGKNHGHWDLLHFTLFARGRSFLGDPASWIYNGYYTAERRGYLYSMEAHNVLTIDGDPLISKRALYPIWTGDVPTCRINAKAFHERVDFVSTSHEAYAPQKHTREMFLVKKRYWIVLDHVTSPDTDWIHTYRRLLHFDFDVEAESVGQSILACNGDAALTCVVEAENACTVHMFKDAYLEPERVKLGHEDIPWVAEVRSEQAGATVMAMVFYPHDVNERPEITCRRVPVNANDGALKPFEAVAYEIVTPHGTDMIYRSFSGSRPVIFDDHQTNEALWINLSGEYIGDIQ